jgi:hypothetical protein
MGRSTPRRTSDGAKDGFPVLLISVFIFKGSKEDLKTVEFRLNSETDQIIRFDQPYAVGISNVLHPPTLGHFVKRVTLNTKRHVQHRLGRLNGLWALFAHFTWWVT